MEIHRIGPNDSIYGKLSRLEFHGLDGVIPALLFCFNFRVYNFRLFVVILIKVNCVDVRFFFDFDRFLVLDPDLHVS